jgi:hypothetical protein
MRPPNVCRGSPVTSQPPASCLAHAGDDALIHNERRTSTENHGPRGNRSDDSRPGAGTEVGSTLRRRRPRSAASPAKRVTAGPSCSWLFTAASGHSPSWDKSQRPAVAACHATKAHSTPLPPARDNLLLAITVIATVDPRCRQPSTAFCPPSSNRRSGPSGAAPLTGIHQCNYGVGVLPPHQPPDDNRQLDDVYDPAKIESIVMADSRATADRLLTVRPPVLTDRPEPWVDDMRARDVPLRRGSKKGRRGAAIDASEVHHLRAIASLPVESMAARAKLRRAISSRDAPATCGVVVTRDMRPDPVTVIPTATVRSLPGREP